MCGSAFAAEPALLVVYSDKPPYSYKVAGGHAGFLIERTQAIFKRADLNYALEEMPVKRITQNIQRNLSPLCSPGWYKLPEREAFARFSLAIQQDLPHVVLAGAHAIERVRAHKTLKELLADPDLKMGTVSGTSYGVVLDAMIRAAAHTALDATVTPLKMAKMVQYKRADYMLIDQEDYQYLNAQGEVDKSDVRPVQFTDVSVGLKRYIMCSKQVSPQVMARMNAAIREVAPGLN